MTLVLDAAPLVAAADLADSRRRAVQEAIQSEPGGLVVPGPVTAEVDYLLGRRLGTEPRRRFLEDLALGRFTVEWPTLADYSRIIELEQRYADLDLGLADLSIVVIAARLEAVRLLTFDERHFRVVRPLYGDAFRLLPADA